LILVSILFSILVSIKRVQPEKENLLGIRVGCNRKSTTTVIFCNRNDYWQSASQNLTNLTHRMLVIHKLNTPTARRRKTAYNDCSSFTNCAQLPRIRLTSSFTTNIDDAFNTLGQTEWSRHTRPQSIDPGVNEALMIAVGARVHASSERLWIVRAATRLSTWVAIVIRGPQVDPVLESWWSTCGATMQARIDTSRVVENNKHNDKSRKETGRTARSDPLYKTTLVNPYGWDHRYVYCFQPPVGSRIPLVEPCGQRYRVRAILLLIGLW